MSKTAITLKLGLCMDSNFKNCYCQAWLFRITCTKVL